MKTTRGHFSVGLAGLLLSAALVGSLGACGGSAGKGGISVATAPAGPPLDFSFHPPETPMVFSVDTVWESEAMGNTFIADFSCQWEAGNWQAEGEDWLADVRFSKLNAAARSGIGYIGGVKAMEKLEGFSIRYRKGKGGFTPVTRPANDAEFLLNLGELQPGLSPLNLKQPAEAPHLGGSWPFVVPQSPLDMLRSVRKDSTIIYTYAADESFQGRDCARLRYQGKIELDGVARGAYYKFDGEADLRITGQIVIEGSALYDKARGFLLQDTCKTKVIFNSREVDDRLRPKGPEMNSVQNTSCTVKYLGS